MSKRVITSTNHQCVTTWRCRVRRESPSEWELCPTTVEGHWGAARSSRVCLSLSAGGIPLPSLSQRTFGLYTCASRRRLLQSPDWLTATKAGQTPGCWRFSGCTLVVFCRRLLDASHNADYSWDSAQICCCHSDIRRTLHHQCNRDERPCQHVSVSFRSEGFGWCWTACPDKTCQSLKGPQIHPRWYLAVTLGKVHQPSCSSRSRLLHTRRWVRCIEQVGHLRQKTDKKVVRTTVYYRYTTSRHVQYWPHCGIEHECRAQQKLCLVVWS